MSNRVKLHVANLNASIAKSRMKKADVAHDIGVSRETFSRWLSGKVEYVEESRLSKLSEILACELSWLSPEIPPEPKLPPAGVNSSDRILGDNFIRLGLYSGLWREVSLLYRTSIHPDVLEHGEVNLALCDALQSLMDMNGSELERWSQPLDPLHKKYQLFEVIARAHLIEALGFLFCNRIEDAHRLLKRIIVQGQSDWLISLAFLLSGFCYWLKSRQKEAYETWIRGIQTFPNSNDDLTIFMQANLCLMLCLTSDLTDEKQGFQDLNKARKLVDSIGYRLGYARCLSYEALLLTFQNRPDEALEKCREVSSFIHRMPKLYQYEAYLLSARIHLHQGNHEAALQYLEMASELSLNLPVFARLLQVILEEFKTPTPAIKDQLTQLMKKWSTLNIPQAARRGK